MNSVVFADVGARARYLSAAGLAHKYFACAYVLTAKALNAQTLAGIIVDVLT
jgi:hypothetical protein